MKVSISKHDLLSMISQVQAVVSTKPVIPILANILVEAADDELTISSTDLTISIKVSARARVEEPGALTLPARRFFLLVRELTAPTVEIYARTPETALIESGSSKFKINGMEKSEFPSMPDMSAAFSFSMDAKRLKELFSRTAFAAAREDANRQMINGLAFNIKDNMLELLATDGRRLAKLMAKVDLPSSFTGSFVIPIRSVEEAIHGLDRIVGDVKVMVAQDKLGLESDTFCMVTKLLSGAYPDVSRIIPEKSEQSIILHREELISLLRQVSLFVPDSTTAAKFTFSNGSLDISAMSSDIGEGAVSMPVNYEGESMDVGFSPHGFLDILRNCKGETVSFDIKNPYNPGLIHEDEMTLFIIMPMRIESEAFANA